MALGDFSGTTAEDNSQLVELELTAAQQCVPLCVATFVLLAVFLPSEAVSLLKKREFLMLLICCAI